MKSFKEASEEELRNLVVKLEDTAIAWAQASGVGGLSCEKWNVYKAIQEVPERALEVSDDGYGL